ncbi:MAG: alkaline phosphatase family protein, partial [Myxococcota bacterium]
MKRVPYPLLVIGLDGASPQVLDALAERLPHITQLRREGASGVARSTQPPATFPAWTSVLTGCPPEVHGIRDMLTRDTPTSVLRPVSGVERRVP